MTITVPIYYKATNKKTVMLGLNWYRNAHFMVLNNAKRWMNEIVKWQVLEQRKPKFNGKVHISFVIYLKRKGSDGGNVRAIIEKFVLDALVKSGVISEDKADIVVSDDSEYFFDKNNPRAEISIYKKL